MNQVITVPFWFYVILLTCLAWISLEKFILPIIRVLFRKRFYRVIDELNTRLSIEIRPFQLTRRQTLIDRLLYDPLVIEEVQRFAEENTMSREEVSKKVSRYAHEIVPSFNAYVYFRLGYWIAKKIARLFYRVRVNFKNEDRFESVDPNATVVFVINHRSNMDYILVSLLVAEHTALSYAVGEWARIWPLQTLIRSMGAFFVRRNSRNSLYRKVLERYVSMATKEGVCQAVFLEGGLSRDGRLREPKMGFLNYIIKDHDLEKDRELVFIPVGLNYDRTIEDRSLLLHLDPAHQAKGIFFSSYTAIAFLMKNLFLMLRNRWRRLGFAGVNFGTPIYYNQYCRDRHFDIGKLDESARREKIDRLAHDLMEEIETIIPVLPIALVCRRVLLQPSQSRDALISNCMLDLHNLDENKIMVNFPSLTRTYNLGLAIDMLKIRHIINEENDQITYPSESKEILQYYAYSISHYFSL